MDDEIKLDYAPVLGGSIRKFFLAFTKFGKVTDFSDKENPRINIRLK